MSDVAKCGALCALTLTLATACGPQAPPRATEAPGDDARARFEDLEDEVLRNLAAIDGRVALRAHITPSDDDLRRVAMAAVLQGDEGVAVVEGVVDPFSFDARARGLDTAKQKIAALPRGGSIRDERELLGRLVDGEVARLTEERDLPRSASALVRAIVETWRSPRDERAAADADRWLARRLGELRSAMAKGDGDLEVIRARELDDALDALERIAPAPTFPASTKELVWLREALEVAASRPAAKARSDWSEIARRAAVHLGVTAPPEELARGLDAALADLHARAAAAARAAGLSPEALQGALEEQVFAAGACLDAVPSSRVRSMAAPPEREPACHLRHLVAHAEDAAARAVALTAMHEHVVVARWALDVARGASTIAEGEGKHHLLVPVLPDARARYERIALARPVAALAAGEAARILVAGDPFARARAWSSLGDVPLDVARRELSSR